MRWLAKPSGKKGGGEEEEEEESGHLTASTELRTAVGVPGLVGASTAVEDARRSNAVAHLCADIIRVAAPRRAGP